MDLLPVSPGNKNVRFLSPEWKNPQGQLGGLALVVFDRESSALIQRKWFSPVYIIILKIS